MTVRAKFKVSSVTRTMGSREVAGRYEPVEIRTVKLSPVYGRGDPNHENTKFWNATPSGCIELGCANLEAAAQFELDKEYYIDFTPAE